MNSRIAGTGPPVAGRQIRAARRVPSGIVMRSSGRSRIGVVVRGSDKAGYSVGVVNPSRARKALSTPPQGSAPVLKLTISESALATP